jgi:Amt family ammonium transporter
MTSTALVLFMTLPGLALFYGGLVRRKNVLSVMAQCLGIAGMVTILWWICGYSLSFSGGNGHHRRSRNKFFPRARTRQGWRGLSLDQRQHVGHVPAHVCNYYSSAHCGRDCRTHEVLRGVAVYRALDVPRLLPACPHGLVDDWIHVWRAQSKRGIKALDFAGGTVVHMSSGWSALVLCLILGKRKGYGREPMPPHSMVLCMVGTGMLWVGWYGFNAGIGPRRRRVASNAFATTTLAAATAGFVWGMVEYFHRGKPSVLGFCSGIVAGLVVITPACGS